MPSHIAIPEDRLHAFISDVVRRIDYDIWKDAFNPETAEEPEFVEGNIEELENVIRSYGV